MNDFKLGGYEMMIKTLREQLGDGWKTHLIDILCVQYQSVATRHWLLLEILTFINFTRESFASVASVSLFEDNLNYFRIQQLIFINNIWCEGKYRYYHLQTLIILNKINNIIISNWEYNWLLICLIYVEHHSFWRHIWMFITKYLVNFSFIAQKN